MSRSRSAEELVARLADDLHPVRPVLALHRQLLAVTAMWAVTAVVVAGWLGLHPLAVFGRGQISTTFVWVLALIGFAGLTLGVASRIPGRERVALAAAGCGALGAAVVIAVALVLPDSATHAGTLAEGIDCVRRSLLLAIPSGVPAVMFALRGAPWRPRVAGVGVAIGATALGALLIHLSCPSPSAWHWLLAHALAPLSAAVPAGLLVAWIFDRLDRRSRRAT